MSAPDPQDIEAILSEVCLSMTSNIHGSRDLLSQLEFVADLIHRAPNPLPKAPSLLVASVASDKGVKVVPLERSVKIGRSAECEVSFPGLREVSRLHCEIVPLGQVTCFATRILTMEPMWRERMPKLLSII